MHSRTNWPFVALLALLGATPVQAQTPADGAVNKQVREGFWLEMDVGYAAFGCEGCGPRSNEVGLGFSIGGAVGDKWLIGLLSSGSVSNFDMRAPSTRRARYPRFPNSFRPGLDNVTGISRRS